MIFIGLEFLAGFTIVVLALADIFATILVPGGHSKSGLKVAARLRLLTLPFWRFLSRKTVDGRRQRFSNSFAPLLFSLAFTAWMALLLVGFGLMFHASADRFSPPLADYWQAVYIAGSSLITLGVSEVDALGFARWLILWAALSGFGVITATVTYILQIQTSLHQRESGVLTLSGIAGKPPSGIGLLESFAALGLIPELPAFFKEWRDWSAATLHSHVSYPVLVYFHSVDAESDWLAALHCVLDAATITMAMVESEAAGAAALLHRSGSRTAAHLCDTLGVEDAEDDETPADVARQLWDRLKAAGYKVKPIEDAEAALPRLRADYAGRFKALATHLGAELAPLA